MANRNVFTETTEKVYFISVVPLDSLLISLKHGSRKCFQIWTDSSATCFQCLWYYALTESLKNKISCTGWGIRNVQHSLLFKESILSAEKWKIRLLKWAILKILQEAGEEQCDLFGFAGVGILPACQRQGGSKGESISSLAVWKTISFFFFLCLMKPRRFLVYHRENGSLFSHLKQASAVSLS